MNVARVFWSGRSQAVRLPKEFRFDSEQVSIKRQGNKIILEPVNDDWGWLQDFTGSVDGDFVAAATEQPPQQERDWSAL